MTIDNRRDSENTSVGESQPSGFAVNRPTSSPAQAQGNSSMPSGYGEAKRSVEPVQATVPNASRGGHYQGQHFADESPVYAHTAHLPQVENMPPVNAYVSEPYAQVPGHAAHASHAAPAAIHDSRSERRGHPFLMGLAGAAVACTVALGGFAIWQTNFALTNGGSSAALGSSTSTSVVAQDEDSTRAEAVASKALPSVAAIDVYTNQGMAGSWYGGNSSSGGALAQSSLGSGVVLSADGYIVTNYHVVEGADALKVTVAGNKYDAEVVGSDPSSDLAVIKAKDATDLIPIEIGDSDNLTIGEWVMSIGSPFGLEQSVATGIVSATSRSQIMNSSEMQQGSGQGITIYPNMIQTDAAINPGNSGGALVDADGKLIGVNTLITSYSGNYSGVGFAIPVNYAVNIAQQIINGETPTHAQLGVSLSTVTEQIASRYDLPVASGAYVAAVAPDSGADSAGLREGDIVVSCDGQPVESASDLMLDIRAKQPGDTLSLEVNRDGKTETLSVTLGSDGATQQASQSQR